MKTNILLIFAVLITLLLVGCNQGTGGKTDPEDCNGDQQCIDCVLKEPVCDSAGDYTKVYEWANSACTLTVGQYCPNECQAGHCMGQSYGAVCFPELDRLCKDTYYSSTGYLYCDVDEIVNCPNGCDRTITPNECKGGTPDCSEGYMVCSDGDDFLTPDTNGDVYECIDGEWELSKPCTGDELCEERSVTNAWCREEWKYCLNRNSYNCILCDREDGYETLEECESQIIYYCLTADKTQCVKRQGGCLDGELSYKGTSEPSVKATCEGQICGKENQVCCENDVCDEDLVCSQHPSLTHTDGSPYMICVDETINNVCDALCADEAWIKINDKVIMKNYFCIWKCSVAKYFNPLIIGICVIVGLIVWLVTYNLIQKKFKKNKAIKVIIPAIFAIIFGLGLYFYFAFFLIVFLIYLIISAIIKNYIK